MTEGSGEFAFIRRSLARRFEVLKLQQDAALNKLLGIPSTMCRCVQKATSMQFDIRSKWRVKFKKLFLELFLETVRQLWSSGIIKSKASMGKCWRRWSWVRKCIGRTCYAKPFCYKNSCCWHSLLLKTHLTNCMWVEEGRGKIIIKNRSSWTASSASEEKSPSKCHHFSLELVCYWRICRDSVRLPWCCWL